MVVRAATTDDGDVDDVLLSLHPLLTITTTILPLIPLHPTGIALPNQQTSLCPLTRKEKGLSLLLFLLSSNVIILNHPADPIH